MAKGGLRRLVSDGLASLPFWGPGGMSSFSGSLGWGRQDSIDYVQQAGPLEENGIVGIGLARITAMFQEAPPLIQARAQDNEGEPVWQGTTGNWAESLLDNPNRHYAASTLWAGVITSLITDGNAYLWAPMDRLGQRTMLMYLPHYQVRVDALDNPSGDELVTRYIYRPIGGAEMYLSPEWVIHLRTGVDPKDMRKGVSALKRNYPSVFGDKAATSYTAGLLANAGVPSVAFSPKEDVQINPKQISDFVDRMRTQFTGNGAGRPGFVPLPVNIDKMGWSPSDMALKELRSDPVDRICAAMGFDPMALGLPSTSKTYSNYKEAMEAAWHHTLRPLKKEIGTQLTRAFFAHQAESAGDFRVWWDFDSVRYLQMDKEAVHDRSRKDFQAGLINRNEARRRIGADPVDGGEVFVDQLRGAISSTSRPAIVDAAARALVRESFGVSGPFDEP